jgi:hypothetical protein
MGSEVVEKRESGMWMDMWKQGETELLCCMPAVWRTDGE